MLPYSVKVHNIFVDPLAGSIESPVVSHEKSLIIAEVLESIRKQIGVVYEQD